MNATSCPRAVVAGAGPAGLTAAFELLQRTNIQPVVFEQTTALGGIAQTYNYRGNRIDLGGHRFFSKSNRVMQWWFDLLPPEDAPGQPRDPDREDNLLLHRHRLSRIFYRQHFFPYPLGITLTVAARLGYWNTFRIGLSYLRAQLFPLKDETYLDAFYINRFGRRLYETFFRDYTEKVWGLPCSQIRADWGAQRVKGLSLKRAVAHAVKDLLSSDFQKAQHQREISLITRFYYPKFGPGQMWETVAGRVRAAGGQIHLRHRVVGLRLEAGRVRAVTVQNTQTGKSREIACDYFFSTMPIKELIGMITPPPPAEVRAVANGLVYRDFLTVGLLLRQLHVRERGRPPASTVPDNWIYIQEPGVQVGRVQIFNNWSPYLVAAPHHTVWLGLEYFVNEGDALWHKPDAELVALGARELEQIGFIRAADVLDGCVLRMPKAYPAYFGSYPQLDVIRRYVDAIPNLFLLGRNGMHRYNNQDHSMLTAMTAVDNIVAGRADKTNLWEINLEMEYHEQKQA